MASPTFMPRTSAATPCVLPWQPPVKTTLLIEVDSNVTLRIDKNMVVADNSELQRQ